MTTNFSDLVERAMQLSKAHMRPVIEKELLHYDILFILDKNNLLDDLVFQGGTALRLCYGASRYSEDLDFAGGKNFSSHQLIEMKTCLEKYLGEKYGLSVFVKEPKDFLMEPIDHIHVDKWQVSIITSPEKKDIPTQKIKIEVINIPAYSPQPCALRNNYDFLPDGYSDTLVMTETIDEIFADKCVSLINCSRYIRYRDICDLRWLKQKGAVINLQYIKNKISDYKITDYIEKLNIFLEKSNGIIHGKAMAQELSRFIPMDSQESTLKKNKFLDFLENEIKNIFIEIKKRCDH